MGFIFLYLNIRRAGCQDLLEQESCDAELSDPLRKMATCVAEKLGTWYMTQWYLTKLAYPV